MSSRLCLPLLGRGERELQPTDVHRLTDEIRALRDEVAELRQRNAELHGLLTAALAVLTPRVPEADLELTPEARAELERLEDWPFLDEYPPIANPPEATQENSNDVG